MHATGRVAPATRELSIQEGEQELAGYAPEDERQPAGGQEHNEGLQRTESPAPGKRHPRCPGQRMPEMKLERVQGVIEKGTHGLTSMN